MKKHRKVLLSLALLSSLNCIPVFTSFASEDKDVVQQNEDIKLEFNLQGIKISTDYNIKDVRLENKILKSGETEVLIKSKSTNEVLETFTCSIEQINKNLSHYTVNKDKSHGPAITTRLKVVFELYSSGSFRQINRILSKDHLLISSGPVKFENSNANVTSATGKFPTLELNMSGYGTLLGEATKTNGVDFSIDSLKGFGFTITNSTSSTWYFRKTFDTGNIRYSLY